ncbi:hypothetical protein D3C86_1296960 [compost metagenome]
MKTVCSTRVCAICSGVPALTRANRSRSSTMKSADLPASMEPVMSPWRTALAPLMV